jgi:hypothetical protein
MRTAKILASCWLGLLGLGSSASAMLGCDACRDGPARPDIPVVSAPPIGQGTVRLAFDSVDRASPAADPVDAEDQGDDAADNDPAAEPADALSPSGGLHEHEGGMDARILDKLTPESLSDMDKRLDDLDDSADW